MNDKADKHNETDWKIILQQYDLLVGLPREQQAKNFSKLDLAHECIETLKTMLKKRVGTDILDLPIDPIANTLFDNALDTELHNPEQVIGKVFGAWIVTKEIAKGGMGQVYLAQRNDGQFEKKVALKIINSGAYSTLTQEKFNDEMRTLARLEHANISRLIDGGISQEGISYFVMELIEGQPITQYAENNKLSLKSRIELIIQLCDAVGFAHQNLIIHGDIKPTNILVDQQGQTKLVDFGIAQPLTQKQPKPFIPKFTPGYSSPEQAQGNNLTTASDVFGICAVLYELCCGQSPRKDAPTTTLVDYKKQMNKPIVAAKLRLDSYSQDKLEKCLLGINKKSLKKSLAQELGVILAKGLNVAPDQRYKNSTELSSDLQKLIDNEPVSTYSQAKSYRIKKSFIRNKLSYLLGTFGFFGIFSIAILALSQAQLAKAEAQKANQVKYFMLDVFAVTHPDQAQGEAVTALNLLDTAQAELESERHDNLKLKAELMTATGVAYGQLGAWEKSIGILSKSLEIDASNVETIVNLAKFQISSGDEKAARKTLGEHQEILDKMLNTSNKSSYFRIQAIMAASNSEFEKSQIFIDQALKIDTENKNTLNIISDQRLQAEHLFLQSKSAEAISLLEAVLAKHQAKLSPTNTLIMGIMSDLGNLYNDVGSYDKSLNVLTKLLENQKAILGENHAELIVSLVQLAGTFRATGKIEEAKELAMQSLTLSKKLFGEKHPQSGKAMNMLGVLAYVTGDIPQAITYLQEVISIYENSYGPDYVDTWTAKSNLATFMAVNGRNEEAYALIDSVSKAQIETLGINHQSTIYSLQVGIRILTALQRHTEAIEIGEKILPITLEELDEDHPLSIGIYFSLGKAYMEAGESQKGLEIMLLIESRGLLNPDNERYIVLATNIADLYLALDNTEKAQEFAEKSYASALKNLGETNIRSIKYMLKLANAEKQNNSLEKSRTHYLKAKTLLENHSGEIKQKMLETIKEALNP